MLNKKQQAMQRLIYLKKWFERHPTFFVDYNKKMMHDLVTSPVAKSGF